MTDVFPFNSQASTGKVKQRKLRAEFGDGYSQTATDGINYRFATWPFMATGTKAYIKSIADWLDAHPASFYFTPDFTGVQGYYECDEYDVSGQETDTWQISATFKQVFRPS